MGIFDFFKRKDASSSNEKTTTSTNNIPTSTVYKIASKYNEYSKISIQFLANGNYAPFAAYEQLNGNIIGYLYIMDDNSYTLSAEEAVTKMKEEFAKRLLEKSIKSYAIFYHSQFNSDGNHAIADAYNEPKAISIILRDDQQIYKTAAIPYKFDTEGFTAGPMTQVSLQESQEMMNTTLKEDKDYFQERITYKAKKAKENVHGVSIKPVNNRSVGDLWSGIFGFDRFQKMSSAILYELIATAQAQNSPLQKVANVNTFELDFDRLKMRVIDEHKEMISAFPTIETQTQIPVTLKHLEEWEHVKNLEATVKGSGRGKFGLCFYATDYAFHREKYHSNTSVPMHITGLIYVLDKHDPENFKIEEGKVSPDFCAYMHSQEWAEYGCFDFIGKVESMEAVNVFKTEEHKGYILKIKLITNEEQPDFFSIDMFVNTNNMRFNASELHVGMKLTGMFQMLGEIAE
ncbi:MAG: hypothetical protein AAF611_20120 [Bacteroidota bacterium]